MAYRLDRVQTASSLSSGTVTVSTWPKVLTGYRQRLHYPQVRVLCLHTWPTGLTEYRQHRHYPQVRILCVLGLHARQSTDSAFTILRNRYCFYMANRLDRVQIASSLSSGTGIVSTWPIGLTGYRQHPHYPKVRVLCLHGL